ncbi:hypothetical protein ADL28_27780 [Streptomyces violaceusniger]|uniref:Secreted protein n=1 Tax=Streptomyces violaceusniger TaxID=68280 RepID=A0A0X3VVY9_STRVO|nr:hypothetical protein ADL28_27780 [Streptomyces violaceusniger]
MATAVVAITGVVTTAAVAAAAEVAAVAEVAVAAAVVVAAVAAEGAPDPLATTRPYGRHAARAVRLSLWSPRRPYGHAVLTVATPSLRL